MLPSCRLAVQFLNCLCLIRHTILCCKGQQGNRLRVSAFICRAARHCCLSLMCNFISVLDVLMLLNFVHQACSVCKHAYMHKLGNQPNSEVLQVPCKHIQQGPGHLPRKSAWTVPGDLASFAYLPSYNLVILSLSPRCCPCFTSLSSPCIPLLTVP